MNTSLNGSYKLVAGQQYDLIVRNILPAGTPFRGKSEPEKEFFPHDLLLESELGDQFHAQICDLNNYFNQAAMGDKIRVSVTNVPADTLPNGKYSVKFIGNITPKRNGAMPANPTVGGTAAAIAMSQSIEWFKFNAETLDDTLWSRADRIFDWLKNKSI